MGNACGCAGDHSQETSFGSINRGIETKHLPEAFKQEDFPLLIKQSVFWRLSDEEKNNMLCEVTKMLIQHGDVGGIKPKNPHLKSILQSGQETMTRYDKAGNKEVYEGRVVDGVANGLGVVRHHDNSVFEGFFSGGFKKGKGVIKNDKGGVIDIFYGDKATAEGPSNIKLPNGARFSCFHFRDSKEGPMYSETLSEFEFCRFSNDFKNGIAVRIQKDYSKLILEEYRLNKMISTPTVYILTDGNKESSSRAEENTVSEPQATRTGKNGGLKRLSIAE